MQYLILPVLANVYIYIVYNNISKNIVISFQGPALCQLQIV